MNFASVVFDTCISGEQLMADYNNVIQAKKYCAASEVYCKYLQNNKIEAEFLYSQFSVQNDKIIKTAVDILDLAIDNANLELAEAALKTIETMKKTYPDFYAAYYKKLFGKTGGRQ